MITLAVILKNIRLIVILGLCIGAVWMYKNWQFQIAENHRQTENNSWQRKYDSLNYNSQKLSQNEIGEYLEFENKDLKKKLDNSNIKLNRIESIVSNIYKYKDTTNRETDITGLVSAIKNSIPKSQPWIDSTKCLTVSGSVLFDGEKLKVLVDDREQNNKSDGVVFWEHNQWEFLGIKTRLFGKKVFTAKQFDDCGETKTMKIEKKK